MILLQVTSGLILSAIATIQGLKQFVSEAELRSWKQFKGNNALSALLSGNDPCTG
jgi:hypothetical protein